MAACTRLRRSGLTLGALFTTRDTVLMDALAKAATSWMLVISLSWKGDATLGKS